MTPANSRTYGYDVRGRLAQAVVQPGSAAFAREDYLYDANGNRIAVERRTVANDTIAAQTDSYTRTAATNRLASITGALGTRSIQYDARGNTLSESRTGGSAVTASYDGHGRLISYARSGEASLTHVYNGMDDRVSTITTSSSGGGTDTRHFVYDPNGRVLGGAKGVAEPQYGSNASDVRAEFIWMHPQVGDPRSGSGAGSGMFGGDDGLGGYMPLAVAANDNNGISQLNWVHGNHMGVPIYYSDASGAQLATPTGYSIPGFPGQSRTFTDLYYNRYRDYDSSTGRYVQADPIGLDGGQSPYSYALNNPLRYTDPTGEIVPIIPIIGGMILGGVGGALVDLATQASVNAWNGKNIWNRDCYDWDSVKVSAVLGAVGGGLGVTNKIVGAAGNAGTKIDDIVRQIEDIVASGGRVKINKAGDPVIMKGNQKVRIDSNNSHGDRPHFHHEKQTPSGNWKDAGNQHRYYFGDDR